MSTQQSYNPWATIDDGSCSGTTCDVNTQYQITMEVTLDNWPGETSWIMNSAGVIGEATQGTYDYSDVGQTYTYEFCVQQSGFELVLNDSYGDGLQNGAFYQLTDYDIFKYVSIGDVGTLQWVNLPVTISFAAEKITLPFDLDPIVLYEKSQSISQYRLVHTNELV